MTTFTVIHNFMAAPALARHWRRNLVTGEDDAVPAGGCSSLARVTTFGLRMTAPVVWQFVLVKEAAPLLACPTPGWYERVAAQLPVDMSLARLAAAAMALVQTVQLGAPSQSKKQVSFRLPAAGHMAPCVRGDAAQVIEGGCTSPHVRALKQDLSTHCSSRPCAGQGVTARQQRRALGDGAHAAGLWQVSGAWLRLASPAAHACER